MARQPPLVDVATLYVEYSLELASAVHPVWRSHKRALHRENLAAIVLQEHPGLQASKWSVYNALLSHPELLEQVEGDVSVAH